MKILIFDNYDSFTYNIYHSVRKLGYNDVDVYRNDKIKLDEIEKYDKIILSPGPGIPSESGLLPDVLKRFASSKSILGICLGEQAIGECFGAKLLNLPDVYHGISSPVKILRAEDPLFRDIPSETEVGRYHSWIVNRENFPDCLQITAEDGEGNIMALAHKEYDVCGVQFHPESVLTPLGDKMLDNWLKS
ncbi:MAG: aminodeoxychorismate/anthranilate synthase component II [Rikenellaceae bacterium]|nr:aminodeoxychorismate/anthranilate synthase component II [Rikenellaceae bacterium]